jgi:autotransporter-associated beta strand protein
LVRQRERTVRARAALLGTTALVAVSASTLCAKAETWLANPGSGDFNTAANWTPASVPLGIAIFGNSAITTLTFSGSRNLDGFQFDPGAPAYTFNLTSGFGLHFHTDGIVNNSSNAPTFNVSNSPLIFDDSSTAGNAIVNLNAGTVQFLGSSTPGAAQLNAVNAGTVFDLSGTVGPGSPGFISAGSIAGAGNFYLGSNTLTVGGNNLSTIVSGVISNCGPTGFDCFSPGASNGSLVKTGTGMLTLSGANTYTGGTTISAGTIVAAHKTGGIIDALGPGTVTLSGGTLLVSINGDLQNAVTFAHDTTSTLSAASGKTLTLTNASTVTLGANAIAQFGSPTDNGTVIFGAGATVDPTASVVVAGGTLKDLNNSLVGLTFSAASTTVNAGATLDFNNSFNQAIHNLLGAGTVDTGSANNLHLTLIVDPLAPPSEFSGTIKGKGDLTITGGGTMILSGANTYKGGTFICDCSTLQLGTLTSVGSIINAVTNDGTFNIVNADTSGITKITNDATSGPGTTNFFNTTTASAINIVNKSGGVTNFFDSASAASATITNRSGGETDFHNVSTAATATIVNNNNGTTNFLDASTADQSSITNNNGGATKFRNASTAGTSDITNDGGITIFRNQSTAGSATITNLHGGSLEFHQMSSAENATIDNHVNAGTTFFNTSTAGSAIISNLAGLGIGVIEFNNRSSAGAATINNAGFSYVVFNDQTTLQDAKLTNNDAGQVFFNQKSSAGTALAAITNNNFGQVNFFDHSTAGFAAITNNDAGIVAFNNHASADNATIVNNAIAAFGGVGFFNHSTAGNAFITTNNGALTVFADHADGGTARFETASGGIVDFSGSIGPNGDGRISAGSIAGAGTYYIGAGNTLVVGGNNLSTEVSGVIADFNPCGCGPAGPGALEKVGSGKLILSGTNTYTGATTINGGILSVNGSIVSSSGVTVNAGGTLGGTGVVPTTIINGGTLSPGNSIGTITVSGGLSFVGAGNYFVEVSGATTDRTNVTGAATLTGTVTASFLPGGALPGHYIILAATGGRTGTFDSLTTVALPSALSASLSYTPTDTVLNLASALTQVTGLNVNQSSVASALDKAFNSGAPLNPNFATLFGLPGSAIPGVLTQLSGEIGTGAPTAGFQTIDQFLNLMLDPFLETRLGDGSVQGRALSFAPQSSVQAALPAELLSYDSMITKAPPMVAPDRRWTVWGAAFGASGRFSGDPVIGSNTLKISTGSFAAGIDYRVSPDTVLGVAVSGGAYNYGLDALGSGRGEVLQAGLYGSTRFADHAYLSGALAYGRHDLSTDRSVTVGGVFDRLSAAFNANSWGGRVETGYRFALMNGLGVTPFAAVQAQRFETPAYAERDLAGLAAFALNYAAQTTTDTRSELGARVDYRMMTDYGALLTWRARAAWGHEFSTERSIAASFQTLPGFGFTVIGAAQAPDVALVSAGAELKLRNGISLSAKFDGEFAGRTQVYGATGALRVNW